MLRNLRELDRYRRTDADVVRFYGSTGDHAAGVFEVPSRYSGRKLLVVASSGEGWDHVSVSSKRHTPTWLEMEQIKRAFFCDDEVVMQLHVPTKDHISVHEHCLHLWRPHNESIPLPPKTMVA